MKERGKRMKNRGIVGSGEHQTPRVIITEEQINRRLKRTPRSRKGARGNPGKGFFKQRKTDPGQASSARRKGNICRQSRRPEKECLKGKDKFSGH